MNEVLCNYHSEKMMNHNFYPPQPSRPASSYMELYSQPHIQVGPTLQSHNFVTPELRGSGTNDSSANLAIPFHMTQPTDDKTVKKQKDAYKRQPKQKKSPQTVPDGKEKTTPERTKKKKRRKAADRQTTPKSRYSIFN